MATIFSLIKRNLKVYYRDKSSVFFSFLSMIIIITLYVLFLGDQQISSIESSPGYTSGARFLVESWMMSGVIAVSTITISMGVLGIMIDDFSDKTIRDFMISPLKRGYIVAGYIFTTWLVTLFVSIFTLIISQVIIVISGGTFISFISYLKVIGIIVVCVFSSSSAMFLVASFIPSANSFSTVSTIIGTSIGFLAGIYVPMGVLPNFIQSIIKFIPISHGAALLRQYLTEEPMRIVFSGASSDVVQNYSDFYGITFAAGDSFINEFTMLTILLGSGLLFFIFSILRLSKMVIDK